MSQQGEKPNHPKSVTYAVYYDGSCPVCTLTMDTLEKTSARESFEMHDVTKEVLPAHIDKKRAMEEIHVTSSDGTTYTNADAVLVLLSQYKGLGWVLSFGLLPGIRWILHAVYRFVATNRYFLLGTMSPVFWTKTIVALGLLVGIVLSLPLWSAERTYPPIPVFILTNELPPVVTIALLVGMIGALTLSLVSSRPRRLLLISFCCLLALVLMDQSRIQAWVVHYLPTLFILSLFSWDAKDVEGKERALNLLRFIVVAMYFWSGVQKVNIQFIEQVFPWMMSTFVPLSSDIVQIVLVAVGLVVPFIEVAIGVGLLIDRLRKWSIAGAFLMCVFVLMTIGPFGHSWNMVVWPWNIVLLLLVCILFTSKASISFSSVFAHLRGWLGTAVLILTGIMPAFYFVNIWDSYPSWSLYSGTPDTATFYLHERVRASLPEEVREVVHTDAEGRNTLTALDWSVRSLTVPPYPEERVFLTLAQTLCAYAERPDDVVVNMSGRIVPFFSQGPTQRTCESLK